MISDKLLVTLFHHISLVGEDILLHPAWWQLFLKGAVIKNTHTMLKYHPLYRNGCGGKRVREKIGLKGVRVLKRRKVAVSLLETAAQLKMKSHRLLLFSLLIKFSELSCINLYKKLFRNLFLSSLSFFFNLVNFFFHFYPA
jgi:hypothetical protein